MAAARRMSDNERRGDLVNEMAQATYDKAQGQGQRQPQATAQAAAASDSLSRKFFARQSDEAPALPSAAAVARTPTEALHYERRRQQQQQQQQQQEQHQQHHHHHQQQQQQQSKDGGWVMTVQAPETQLSLR